MRTGTDIVAWDALDLVAAIAAREVSCEEVMRAYLAQIDRLNPAVNAIVSLQEPGGLLALARERDGELARGLRRGPMHGLPQAVKDLFATRGIATTRGSPLFAGEVPAEDAIMVERMRASGAILVGKTNVPEFGFGSQTFNPVFGATLNAYDRTRTAGGSSGGAAVALALEMLPVADGSDNGGSLRNPAAYNNLFGLRPSYGRIPVGGDEVFLPAFTVPGPMARTVPDLAMLLSVQAGHDPRMPNSIQQDPAIFAERLRGDLGGKRIGWIADWGGRIPFEAGILPLCEAALGILEDLGATVEPVVPDFPLEEVWSAWSTLRAWNISGTYPTLIDDPAKRAQIKPEAVWEMEAGRSLSAEAVYRASQRRSAFYEAMRRLFTRFDHLVMPGAQVFPFDVATRWPETVAGRPMDTYHRWMEVMVPFTMSNSPTISVPVGFGEAGLPMGMQIAGPNHAELAVLRTAHAYDEATGWVRRRKPDLLTRADAPASGADGPP